jgi:hypothetical protein
MMSCIEAPFARESGPFQVLCPGWMSGGGQLPALGLLWQVFSMKELAVKLSSIRSMVTVAPVLFVI